MPPSEVECIHPVRQSGYHVDARKSSRSSQTSRAVKEKISSVQAADQNRNLHDQLKLGNRSSKSYVDVHHGGEQVSADGLFPLKPLRTFQKQSVEGKSQQDELVKHMSNLPQYLQRVERGTNPQEKVLNFGVLDWGRLENWKYNQKPAPHSSHMYSPSSSNTSSPFSTVGSSTMSTRSDSGSTVHRKHSPTQGAHLASSNDYHFTVLKPARANPATLQDKVTVPKISSVVQQKPPGTTVPCQRYQSKMTPEKGMKSSAHPKVIKEMGSSSSSSKICEVTVSPKGKLREGDAHKEERLPESTYTAQQCPGRDKTIVLLLPKKLSDKRFSTPPRNREYTSLTGGKQAETGRTRNSGGFCINEVSEFSSSTLPFSRTEPCKLSHLNTPRPVGALDSKDPSEVSDSSSHSGEMHTPESMQEENKLNSTPADLVLTGRLKGSGMKAEEPFLEPRSARCGVQSPNRRLSFGKAKICRSLSFKEDSDLPQLSSAYITTKSGPVESVACSDGSREKSTISKRNRSSPLRRLLDPLLRPKTANSLTTVETLHDEARICSPSDGRLPTSVRPVKTNVSFSGSVPEDTSGACQDEKQGASMVQALLQVTVKNQLPWFTFAVDNHSDILAATMRKTSSTDKYDCSWIYTFYSFHKSKKKSGSWIGHGSKGRGHDYVPNIVGQMKVNGSRTQHDSRGPLTVREFVLFDVEPNKADEETPNLVSNAELGGIIIKVPTNGKQKSSNHENLSNMKRYDNSIDGSFVGIQSLSSIVVVLPSGVHSLSAAGLPSPLLERWKSGGSCDCGGWDVGCQLRVLSNEDQHAKNFESSELYGAQDKFDLYVKGGGSRETAPSLSFANLNKGVHSIDFNASISSLQAFSICIAFLHCKNLAKVNNLFQELTAQDPLSMEPQRTKLCTQMEATPPCCATFPPPSPVRRA